MPAPQQPIAPGTTTPEAVIEFGSQSGPDRSARRWSVAGFGRALADDHRAVPLSAALGGVAAFASMVSEWQVTAVDGAALGGGEIGRKLLPADLADLGSFGAGYLAGLFLLVAAIVLTLFGPVAGRRYARLAGLGVGGTLLGLMLALTSVLGDQSRIVSRLYALELNTSQLQVSYGRGLWCGLFTVVAALVALYLSGRHAPEAADAAALDTPDADEVAVWSWRRPRTRDEEAVPDAPFDLTVTSTTPFTTRGDDRDKANGS